MLRVSKSAPTQAANSTRAPSVVGLWVRRRRRRRPLAMTRPALADIATLQRTRRPPRASALSRDESMCRGKTDQYGDTKHAMTLWPPAR